MPQPTTKAWRWREECAVFGISSIAAAARYVTLGLHALQHRGQEAAGILSYCNDAKAFHIHRAHGLVSDVFANTETLHQLQGAIAIGHNRYSTSPGQDIRNLQPVFAEFSDDGIGLVHNGNITNANKLRNELQAAGAIFQSESDSEIIIHLMAHAKGSILQRFQTTLRRLQGAFSLILMDSESLYATRDPHGFRPLQLGKMGSAYVVASESCAFDIIDATYLRDIEPGEIVVINKEKLQSYRAAAAQPRKFCIFEYIYFARPDSIIEEQQVYLTRKRFGHQLAKEFPLNVDLVVPIPDSGIPAALGYAEALRLPFDFGLIRNHYVGRTFIEPQASIRNFGVRLKHNANRALLTNKRVVLIDDSLVRGTTAKKIISTIRAAGATEVHLLLSSPPIKFPCFYGIDTPERSKLFAAHTSIAAMQRSLNLDSLGFLSLSGLEQAITPDASKSNKGFCDACFSGNYPVPPASNSPPCQSSLPKIADAKINKTVISRHRH